MQTFYYLYIFLGLAYTKQKERKHGFTLSPGNALSENGHRRFLYACNLFLPEAHADSHSCGHLCHRLYAAKQPGDAAFQPHAAFGYGSWRPDWLCRRMEITKKVAAYKKENNLPVYHPQREQAVIEKVSALGGREYSDALAAVYQCIMGQSKALQRQWLEQE